MASATRDSRIAERNDTMKKTITLALALALLLALAAPASAAYNFEGPPLDFATATNHDNPVSVPAELANERSNKDAAVEPPPYGFYSGEIPTDYISPYHNNGIVSSGASNSTATVSSSSGSSGTNVTILPSGMMEMTSSTSVHDSYLNRWLTAPSYYSDGSMGGVSIPAVGIYARVYQGTASSTMNNGWGHFEDTSAWDGNVCLAGHNRGAKVNVGAIKDLKNGDIIQYVTPYGMRTYVVYFVGKIANTDSSRLAGSMDNIITLITCVENDSSRRWCVQAREVK